MFTLFVQYIKTKIKTALSLHHNFKISNINTCIKTSEYQYILVTAQFKWLSSLINYLFTYPLTLSAFRLFIRIYHFGGRSEDRYICVCYIPPEDPNIDKNINSQLYENFTYQWNSASPWGCCQIRNVVAMWRHKLNVSHNPLIEKHC